MIPLTLAPQGTECVIKKITGRDDIRRHFETMGFVVGETVMVVTQSPSGFIIKAKGISVAIDNNMANRIMI